MAATEDGTITTEAAETGPNAGHHHPPRSSLGRKKRWLRSTCTSIPMEEIGQISTLAQLKIVFCTPAPSTRASGTVEFFHSTLFSLPTIAASSSMCWLDINEFLGGDSSALMSIALRGSCSQSPKACIKYATKMEKYLLEHIRSTRGSTN